MNDGKAGCEENCLWASSLLILLCSTFVDAWHGMMKIHETIAENRIRFSQRLIEMSDDLLILQREVEKNRKQVSLSFRYFDVL